jgi:hypothetical protein
LGTSFSDDRPEIDEWSPKPFVEPAWEFEGRTRNPVDRKRCRKLSIRQRQRHRNRSIFLMMFRASQSARSVPMVRWETWHSLLRQRVGK